MSALLYPDRYSSPVGENGLADWGAFLGFPKGSHTDWTQFSEEMLTYCGNDVELGHRVYKYLIKQAMKYKTAVRLEHDTQEIITQQILNGVTLNVKKTKALIDVVREAKERIISEMRELFPAKHEDMKTPQYYTCDFCSENRTKKSDKCSCGERQCTDGPLRQKITEFNPGSGEQVARVLMEKYGWKPTKLTDSAEKAAKDDPSIRKNPHPNQVKTSKEVLEILPWPEALAVTEYRVVANRLTEAEKWIECAMFDGRVHGDVAVNGCVTGRMAHSNPNANLPKVKTDKKTGEVKLGRAGGFGFECRSCFGPRKGWWQVGKDASSLEARMLANRMWVYDNGEYAKVVLTGDIHSVNAAVLGISRDLAKNWFYAFMYGAADEKLGYMAGETNQAKAKKLGAELRAKFMRGIPAMGAVIADIQNQVRTRSLLIGLDGRPLPIRSQHSALNTQLQSDGAVVMKKALTLYYADATEKVGPHGEDWGLMLNVHDEFQTEARTKKLAETLGKLGVASITKAGIQLGVKVHLDGEYKIGRSWAECH